MVSCPYRDQNGHALTGMDHLHTYRKYTMRNGFVTPATDRTNLII